MKFTVADLKLLKKMVNCANAEDEARLNGYLQKKQPGFFSLIQDVSIDPRCAAACRYCTLFCGLVLEIVDLKKAETPSHLSESEFRDIAGQVARQDKNIGRRGKTILYDIGLFVRVYPLGAFWIINQGAESTLSYLISYLTVLDAHNEERNHGHYQKI